MRNKIFADNYSRTMEWESSYTNRFDPLWVGIHYMTWDHFEFEWGFYALSASNRVATRISFQNSLTFPWLSFIFPWSDKYFKYNITVLAVISGHFKMYVALSPNYGFCTSAQKNNINNFVQIAHSDCLITTIILQVSYQPWKKYRNLKEFPVK